MRLAHLAALASVLAGLSSAAIELRHDDVAVGQRPLIPSTHVSDGDYQSSKKKKSSLRKELKRVRKALRKAEIIPTVVDDFDPWLLLNITWPNSKRAKLGNTKKPEKLSETPKATIHAGNYGGDDDDDDNDAFADLGVVGANNLVLTMTDPDAPSRDNPIWSEICHWIAVGLPVHIDSSPPPQDADGSESKSRFQTPLVSYKPPGPPPLTGKHRYVFIAWTPANRTNFPLHLVAPKERQFWGTGKAGGGVRDWAAAMGLEPFAANFLYSENAIQLAS